MARSGILEQADFLADATPDGRASQLAHSRQRIKTRKLLVAFHLAAISLQLGLVAGLFGLQIISGLTAQVERRAVLYSAIANLEFYGLYPLVVLTVLSGVVLGIYVRSGFFTAWWLIVKQIIFGLVGVVTAIVIGPGSVEVADLTSQVTTATSNSDLANFQQNLTLALGFYLIMGVGLVVISILKPWGRRK